MSHPRRSTVAIFEAVAQGHLSPEEAARIIMPPPSKWVTAARALSGLAFTLFVLVCAVAAVVAWWAP